jgi:hypothetical protein
MDWDPQPAPPPSAELQEATRQPPATEQTAETGGDSASGWIPLPGEVDPETGHPLPPGSKAYQREFSKTFGAPPNQARPGAKFRFSFGKRFGPFPLEEGHGPDSPPEELYRAAIRSAIRRSLAPLVVAVAAAVIVAVAVLYWLINSP